jgi:hypothetical protein
MRRQYDFRHGPTYPWRTDSYLDRDVVTDLNIDSGLDSQVNIESLIDPTSESSVISQPESTHPIVYEHLAFREQHPLYLPPTRRSRVASFELEDLDIMSSLNMTHTSGRALFTGDSNGPSLAHLRQDYNAMKSELKLKSTEDLNANDYFNFIVKMLGGGAKDQAAALERQMANELREKNAAEHAQYIRNKEAYDIAKLAWDNLSAEARVGQVEPQAPVAHVDDEVYDKPVEKFWAMMEDLYPEKSRPRITEFRNFAMRAGETIASLVQRMQSLRHSLNMQEESAVFKLIHAIRPTTLGEEVRRQLYAIGTEIEQWTIALVGKVAVRIDRAHSQESLWVVTVQNMDAPRAMSRTDAPYRPSRDQGGRAIETRTCHKCGKSRHIATFCRSPPAYGTNKPPVVTVKRCPNKGQLPNRPRVLSL